jgi:hypothetical protein
LTRRAADDPEVKALLALDEGLIKDFGSGLFEDVFPYLKDILPTAKWTKLVKKTNELLDFLRTKFKEHVETFELG